ncbi:MAG: DUF1016 family protein [Desulfobulbaceae bacterium]|nr:DUF1016 domain-containing protein [Candidatus Kapabacteria bacterium]MBS4000664.1 DUF1016 family protein [Desulfobulbaceae bacterium]
MKEISKKIIDLVEQSREQIAKIANSTMVHTYFYIGALLIEELQMGKQRADYGTKLLQLVSSDLTAKFGKGFSVQNLERMRNFYLIYSNSSNELRNSEVFEKSSISLRISSEVNSAVKLLPISWSHYLFLMNIDNENERQFYEIESYLNRWKLKELQRQFNSGLFERLALSRDRDKVIELSRKGFVVEKSADIIKDPLVLEFLGLEDKPVYSETDLETAIINQIENFMLELGKGFFFGGRQVRITFDEEHFRVDLVFYNRLLKCFVLIDLKIGKLTHQDLGQMQMYVNYFDRYEKLENENPTIGIIICKNRNQSLVEITLPENNQQIFATKYSTVIPPKEAFIKLLTQYNE